MRLRPAPGAACLAIVADRVAGERGLDPHPVALFGHAMQRLEARLYRDTRGAGVAHAAVGVALAAILGSRLPAALVGHVTVAGRMLGETALDVASALGDGDLDRARSILPSLVGRDPVVLDEREICRAVVESVAENTVDALVAPALWTATAGAPGAAAYRAVNTLDSMVGHRSARYARFGWASARLDDVANWIPARATAVLVAAVRPGRARAVVTMVRRDAGAHPSPNAGVAEAAFAAALGVTLGGVNRYGSRIERRPALGAGGDPQIGHIGAAVRLSRDVGAALAIILAGFAIRRAWGGRDR